MFININNIVLSHSFYLKLKIKLLNFQFEKNSTNPEMAMGIAQRIHTHYGCMSQNISVIYVNLVLRSSMWKKLQQTFVRSRLVDGLNTCRQAVQC